MAQYCIILIQVCMVSNALEKIIETIGKRHFSIKRKWAAFCAQLIIGLSGSDQSTYFLKCKSSRCACDQKSWPKKVKLSPPIDLGLLFKKLSIYRIKACNLRPALVLWLRYRTHPGYEIKRGR
jgi:hypothetical protein